jgi:MFS family permease
VSLINTLVPIVGGSLMDRFGPVAGTLGATTLIVIGSLLTTLAAHYRRFAMMVVGRVVFGLGSGVIVTLQESILSTWFRSGRVLSLMIGLQLSSSQISGFLGTLLANPLASSTHNWVWVFWVAFLLCVFSAVMNVAYLLLVRSVPQETVRERFGWATVLSFPGVVWLIVAIEGVLCMVWAAFQIIATEYVMMRNSSVDGVAAGVISSMSQVVPIVLTPLLGMLLDRWGRRVSMLATSVAFLFLCCTLLAYAPTVTPVVGMLFFSLSMALGPLPMITSLGLLLPPSAIGTGLGIFKSANNAGSTIMDILVGVVQDRTAHQAYTGVLLAFIIIIIAGALVVALLAWVQARYYENVLEAARPEPVIATANDSRKRWGFLYMGLFATMLLLSWILFFVFSIHGNDKTA